jgi:hypothetical protein
MPDWPKMLSKERFSSISANTLVIFEKSPSRVIPSVHPPEARLMSKLLALTAKVRFWSTSPLCSWHSFQCGKGVVPEFWLTAQAGNRMVTPERSSHRLMSSMNATD